MDEEETPQTMTRPDDRSTILARVGRLFDMIDEIFEIDRPESNDN